MQYYPPIIPDGTLCLIHGLVGTDEYLNGTSVTVAFDNYIEMDYGINDCVYFYSPHPEHCCRILGKNLMPLSGPSVETQFENELIDAVASA